MNQQQKSYQSGQLFVAYENIQVKCLNKSGKFNIRMTMSRTQEAEIILIDEEEEEQIRRDYPLPGIAQRILNKQKLPSGQVKFLVKWQGYSEEDATWETEEVMREKHSELIQDYEFYALTGQHLENKTSDSKQPNSKRAIKCAGRNNQTYTLQDHPSTVNNEKHKSYEDKHKNNEEKHKINEEKHKSNEEKKKIPEPSRRERIKSKMQEKQDQRKNTLDNVAHFEPMGLFQKQFELENTLKTQFVQQSKNFINLTANKNDKIESVQLSSINDEMQRYIYTVDWKSRANGDKPLTENYSHQLMTQMCPVLSLKFLESQLFDVHDQALNINFSCQGQTEDEKHNLIFQAINPNKLTKREAFKQNQSNLVDQELVFDEIPILIQTIDVASSEAQNIVPNSSMQEEEPVEHQSNISINEADEAVVNQQLQLSQQNQTNSLEQELVFEIPMQTIDVAPPEVLNIVPNSSNQQEEPVDHQSNTPIIEADEVILNREQIETQPDLHEQINNPGESSQTTQTNI